MQILVEKIGSLGRKLNIVIPSNQVDIAENKKIKNLSKTINIDGFRKGHVPERIIRQKYGKQAHKEVIHFLLENSLKSALKDQNLKPVIAPKVESIEERSGQDLLFSVYIEIFPKIELCDFSNIELEKIQVEILEKDIDEQLEKSKDQLEIWHTIDDRSCRIGDKIIVDFQGIMNNKPIDNKGKIRDFEIELGAGQLIPGFEEGLIGAKTSEQRVLDLCFPKEYKDASLAKKRVQFIVMIKEIKEKKQSELDERSNTNINLKEDTINKIRNRVKNNMTSYANNIAKLKLRNAALEILLEKHQFDIPKMLVDHEIKSMKKQQQNQHDQDKCNVDNLEEIAIKQVKIRLILDDIIIKNDLKPEEDRIREKITELLSIFGNSSYIHKALENSKDLMDKIRHQVLSEQATDLIVSQAKCINKSVSFQEITNGSN